MFCAFMYMKAQKHTHFNVKVPFSAYFSPPPPLHHNGKGSIAYCSLIPGHVTAHSHSDERPKNETNVAATFRVRTSDVWCTHRM